MLKLNVTCIIFILFSLINLSNPISAQTEKTKFEHLGLEDGLSLLRCDNIIQDKKGFIWVGTTVGLNRYNGSKFDNYYSSNQIEGSLSHSTIKALFEDNKGNLWIGTSFGLNKFDRDKVKFIHYFHQPDDPQSLSDNHITCLYQDKNGNSWIGTRNGGLNLRDPETGSFFHFKFDENNPHSISSNHIYCIYEDSEERLWIGTESGLNLFEKNNKKFIRYLHNHQDPSSLSHNLVKTILEDKNGNLLIGTYGGGINIFDPEKNGFINKNNTDEGFVSLNSRDINIIFQDHLGTLWVGTEFEGLFQWDKQKKQFYNYKADNTNPFSISGNTVRSIYEDISGVLWIGSIGLNKLYIENKKFNLHIPKDSKSGIAYILVRAFYKDKNNHLWIGTEGEGLFMVDKNDYIVSNYRPDNTNEYINGYQIYSIYEDTQGDVWVGTENGLNKYNPEKKAFIPYVINEIYSDSEPHLIRTICEDFRGNLWIGWANNGLCKFNKETKEYKIYQYDDTDPNSLSDNNVFKIYEDHQNNLWIATFGGGLNKFDRESGSFVHYKCDPANPNTITDNYLITIYEDSNKNFWVGTVQGGLNKFERETSTFTYVNNNIKFPSNCINGILEDPKGNLWISHNKGLSKYNPTNDTIKNYTQDDGLQSNEFNGNACYLDKDGIMYFGGPRAYNSFFPDSIIDNSYFPEIVITDFKIFNESVSIGKKYDNRVILDKSISETNKIELTYKERVISFDFMSTNYAFPEKNQYTYTLEGLDENWNYIGNRRYISYTNIPPGEYTLHIKSSNNDGIWNEIPTSLIILITPPFWNTLWFKILVILIVIGSFIAFYRIRVSIIEKQKEELERNVFERTYELQMTNTELEEKKEEISVQIEILAEKNEEILTQKQQVEEQKYAIEQYNKELELHRTNLEKLIKERTNELEKAKEKAEESDRLKTSFLANMSHEIRTPMNAIIGFTDLIVSKEIDDEDKDSVIKLIHSNSDTLLQLIDDIIDISKIQEQQLTLRNSVFSLNQLMQDLYVIFCNEAKNIDKSDIQFKLNIDQKNIEIESDQIRIKQILTNLLSNAFKYTDSGFIEFGYDIKDSNTIQFYVKDTGIGMDHDKIDHIFTQFRKIEHSSTKLYRGVGLGLSISKLLVELLGGEIWAKSELGKGSVFYFTIPIKFIAEASTIEEAIQEEPETGGVKNNWEEKVILIAEDEETNFLFIKSVIKKINAKTIWAKNGKEAIQLFNKNPVDLVLMDIKMPEMDGYEATRLIRKKDKKVPVIAVTAFAFSTDEEKALNSGCNDYIAKPINRTAFIKLIKKHLL